LRSWAAILIDPSCLAVNVRGYTAAGGREYGNHRTRAGCELKVPQLVSDRFALGYVAHAPKFTVWSHYPRRVVNAITVLPSFDGSSHPSLPWVPWVLRPSAPQRAGHTVHTCRCRILCPLATRASSPGDTARSGRVGIREWAQSKSPRSKPQTKSKRAWYPRRNCDRSKGRGFGTVGPGRCFPFFHSVRNAR